MSYISDQNYNSQGEWRSDGEVQHQGQGSHLKVTFQSTQQMLPIYLRLALSPVLVLHHYLSLPLLLHWLSFTFLLFLILHTPPRPPPQLCDVLTRQLGGSSVSKGSANERSSGVNVLTYLCWTREERSLIPRGQTLSLFYWGV